MNDFLCETCRLLVVIALLFAFRFHPSNAPNMGKIRTEKERKHPKAAQRRPVAAAAAAAARGDGTHNSYASTVDLAQLSAAAAAHTPKEWASDIGGWLGGGTAPIAPVVVRGSAPDPDKYLVRGGAHSSRPLLPITLEIEASEVTNSLRRNEWDAPQQRKLDKRMKRREAFLQKLGTIHNRETKAKARAHKIANPPALVGDLTLLHEALDLTLETDRPKSKRVAVRERKEAARGGGGGATQAPVVSTKARSVRHSVFLLLSGHFEGVHSKHTHPSRGMQACLRLALLSSFQRPKGGLGERGSANESSAAAPPVQNQCNRHDQRPRQEHACSRAGRSSSKPQGEERLWSVLLPFFFLRFRCRTVVNEHGCQWLACGIISHRSAVRQPDALRRPRRHPTKGGALSKRAAKAAAKHGKGRGGGGVSGDAAMAAAESVKGGAAAKSKQGKTVVRGGAAAAAAGEVHKVLNGKINSKGRMGKSGQRSAAKSRA